MENLPKTVCVSLYKPYAQKLKSAWASGCKTLAKKQQRTKTLGWDEPGPIQATFLASRQRLHPRNTAADLNTAAAVERAQCWHLQSVQCCRQRGHRRPAALSTHSGNRCARRGGFARNAAVPKRCRRNDDDAARCCSAHGARKPSSRPKPQEHRSHCKPWTASWSAASMTCAAPLMN